MVLQFPSGRVSVSIQDLQENELSQPCCGICEEHWVLEDDGCIMDQLLVLHPCQHLVGSGCWSTGQDEQKDKCPVCEVKIVCSESVRVHNVIVRFNTSTGKKLEKKIGVNRGEAMSGKKKMEQGLNIVDVEAIISYLDIRLRIETVKGNLDPLLAPAKTVTPEQQERLALFVTSIQRYEYLSKERKIAFALFTFNVNRETDFTLEDLKKVLPSTEDRIRGHFAAILEGKESASEEEQPDIEEEQSDTTE